MRGSLRGAAALCAAAGLLAGCGSSSNHSSTAAKQPPTATLTRAAFVSSAAPGYRAVISLKENVPSVGTITATGTGAFQLKPKHQGSMVMRLSIPSAASSGLGTLQMQAVYVPGTIYMKLPPQLASRIPGGKPWLLINLNQLGKAAGIPGLGSLANSSSSLNNPAQYVSYLRATTDGTVRNLGQATINGVSTTHYHAVIDLNKLPDVVPASSRASVQQLVAALKKRGTKTQLPIDAWIDSSQQIRRVVITYTQPVNGQKATITTQVDFVQYGPQPAPTVPPASQTQNLLSLVGGRP
jgi:hypothetical protein